MAKAAKKTPKKQLTSEEKAEIVKKAELIDMPLTEQDLDENPAIAEVLAEKKPEVGKFRILYAVDSDKLDTHIFKDFEDGKDITVLMKERFSGASSEKYIAAGIRTLDTFYAQFEKEPFDKIIAEESMAPHVPEKLLKKKNA